MVSTGGGGFDLPFGGSPLEVLVIVGLLLALFWFAREHL